jgi:hypothetical protein
MDKENKTYLAQTTCRVVWAPIIPLVVLRWLQEFLAYKSYNVLR